MQPGDLVYHIEDIKDGMQGPVPGLIIEAREDSAQFSLVVYFVDRVHGEYHLEEDLIKVEDYSGDKNDYR
tara:strand:+ start:27 stop:236 length:210 start_codon:yes stop_codon:yes gene_type:complete